MSNPTTQSVAYFDGILDVYYAVFATDDTSAAKPTYGTPAVLGKSIEVTITPRYIEGKLYASNTAVRNEKRINGYDVSLHVDQVLAAARRAVLGRTVDSNGVEILTSTTTPPYVALGLAQTKDNGEKELWWLYKGKFAEFDKSAKTKGDTIEYQTPTLTASFDRRIFDDKLCAIVETDATDIGTGVAAGWFSAVYETPAPDPDPDENGENGDT